MDRLTRITPVAKADSVTTAEIMEVLPEGRYRVSARGQETIARGSEGVAYAPGNRALLAATDHGHVLLNALGSRSSELLEVRIHD